MSTFEDYLSESAAHMQDAIKAKAAAMKHKEGSPEHKKLMTQHHEHSIAHYSLHAKIAKTESGREANAKLAHEHEAAHKKLTSA